MLQLGLESSCVDVTPLGRVGGWVGEKEKKKINHIAGSAVFHRDMLCWNGNGVRAGEGQGAGNGVRGRGGIQLGSTGRKAKDGEVGSITRKTDKGK